MNSNSQSAGAPAETRDGWYAWYVVAVLSIASALSFIDRQVISLLIEPIKADLKLTDFQISTLQGLAFISIYALMGIPLGYLSDRWPRRILVAVGIFVWTAATAACGLATSFWLLFAARASVGLGQASLTPSVYSMLPDYFEPARLARPFALFTLAGSVGVGLAYVASGYLIGIISTWPPWELPFVGVLAPWQIVFIVAALPGPVIALLALTIREPKRRTNTLLRTAQETTGFGQFLSSRIVFFAAHLTAGSLYSLVAYGVISWTPSFFIRTFGWSPAQVGLTYGGVLMLTTGGGSLFVAYLVEAFGRMKVRAPAVMVFLTMVTLMTPFAILYPLCGNAYMALAILGIVSFCIGGAGTLSPMILQLVTPHEYRGRVGGIFMLVLAVVGVAIGPAAIAAVTDFVFHDTQRLNHSITVVAAVAGPLSVVLTFLTRREFLRWTVTPDNTAT